MRQLLIAIFVLFAASAFAQETYSLNANAAQVTDLTAGVNDTNQGTCIRLSLSVGCTQAQACTAAGAVGGASCTAAQARAASARIWPNSQAGREEFVTFVFAVPRFQDLKAFSQAKTRDAYCVWWKAQNQTTKDAECVKTGRAVGCEVCQ